MILTDLPELFIQVPSQPPEAVTRIKEFQESLMTLVDRRELFILVHRKPQVALMTLTDSRERFIRALSQRSEAVMKAKEFQESIIQAPSKPQDIFMALMMLMDRRERFIQALSQRLETVTKAQEFQEFIIQVPHKPQEVIMIPEEPHEPLTASQEHSRLQDIAAFRRAATDGRCGLAPTRR